MIICLTESTVYYENKLSALSIYGGSVPRSQLVHGPLQCTQRLFADWAAARWKLAPPFDSVRPVAGAVEPTVCGQVLQSVFRSNTENGCNISILRKISEQKPRARS